MKLLILGAGGHGRVVADVAQAAGWQQVDFLDDRYPTRAQNGAWPIIGALRDLGRLGAGYDGCFAAVGDARFRLELLEQAASLNLRVPVLVHPAAVVSGHAEIGAGTVIMAGAVVNAFTSIGVGCIVNTHASVDHDCQLGPAVHICPGAHLAGDVHIGARTWFGLGAVAIQGLRIGSEVTVGAGAACISDVRDSVTVVGVPAREKQ
jgi:sugar O-acyltransferase (sialic acid O-acetyltransferase NeuD family)